MSTHATMKAAPSLVLLGPQLTTWPSPDLLIQLREFLIQDPRLLDFLQAIRDLPRWTDKLVHFEPRFGKVTLTNPITALLNWIENGQLPKQSDTCLNILLAPLTVIIQHLLYFHYEFPQKTTTLDSIDKSVEYIKPIEAQGLCTGFLMASALSLSTNIKELNMYASVALRLALCIGAAVDLDAIEPDIRRETSCLAVRWRMDNGKAGIKEILTTYTDAYVSVVSEPNCVTITLPTNLAADLMNSLVSQGYAVKDTGLHGRYHSPALKNSFQTLLRFCESDSGLQLPNADRLVLPLRSPIYGEKITSRPLHEIGLRSILTERFNWDTCVTAAVTDFAAAGYSNVVTASVVNFVPKSLTNDLNLRVTNLSNLVSNFQSSTFSVNSPNIDTPEETFEFSYPPNAIAIVGMACKFPGADSLSEFWELIRTGSSMVEEVPESRFPTKNLRRTVKSDKRFWGNFVRDVDAFDHRFFKKSAREAAQMDPQQRLLLEVAYQAMQSSGYFSKLEDVEDDIGCFIGVCASDYNDNVASHPPTAYSSLGTLRAFLSGKISHYFGWSGPSVTYDTACSSSAVAIDAACKALMAGDCSQAVAGGANIFTNVNFYQNLMAASFLSPTGATKSFDSRADGYCRGEGVGLVVLKKLSTAVADRDNIQGVILATAVNQNHNAVPITVPYSASQVALYKRVTRLAGINPMEISFVEAHGTGTPVGDPIECDSIQQVFGGPNREQTLYLGSIKANIGHTEATSAACVNNYGAAGSNAAMIVCQAPTATVPTITNGTSVVSQGSPKYPIYVAAHTVSSLNSYLQRLLEYVIKVESEDEKQNILGSIAFSLHKTQNRNHPNIFTTTVARLSDLRVEIEGALSGSISYGIRASDRRPVVLAFGGQVSNTVGLPIELYKSSSRLRFHLEQCDTMLQQLGYPSIFPEIFVSQPIESVVSLHSMLFSVQYSVAKAWMDSGLEVNTIIGHSFGQLTALCVSGSLPLKHGLELVVGRAALMHTHWGKERGSMISIETTPEIISKVMSSINAETLGVEIACYNGPTSYVLVGSAGSIKAVEEYLSAEKSLGIAKWKVLNVPYGFHSQFTEPILPGLLELAKSFEYEKPQIPLETCSDGESWSDITAPLVTGHSREPVYFGQAVQRIASRLGTCSWVEAGMNSSITNMIRRALDDITGHDFHPANFSTPNSLDSLAKITLDLQKGAQNVKFWPFHDNQSSDYKFLQLPPYQFEKTRHWLEWIDYAQPVAEAPAPAPERVITVSPSFMTKVGITSSGAEFLFNPQFNEYRVFVQGHRVLNNPLCPAPLYLELVARGIKAIEDDLTNAHLLAMENLEIKAPLGIASNRLLTLKVERADGPAWTFEFSSRLADGSPSVTSHASGTVIIQNSRSKALSNEFIRYGRLIGYDRIQELVRDPKATSMQGSSVIYKAFEKVVHYDSFYKGVQRIAARDHEVVGLVHLPRNDSGIPRDTAYHPLMVDNFVQVSGLHVNALSQCGDDEVYVCTKLEKIQPTSAFGTMDPELNSWTVYSSFTRVGERNVVNDIFVFDTDTKELAVYILGAHFTKVAMNSLARVLSSANNVGGGTIPTSERLTSKVTATPIPIFRTPPKSVAPLKVQQPPQVSVDLDELLNAVKIMLSKVVDVDVKEINGNTTPDQLGIDSLMVTEVLSDIQKTFDVDIPLDDFTGMGDVNAVVEYLRRRVKGYSINEETAETRPQSAHESEGPFSDEDSDTVSSATSTSVGNDEIDDSYRALSDLVKKSLERDDDMTDDVVLAEAGMDSLLCMEVVSDIEKDFGVHIDATKVTNDTTFREFFEMVFPNLRAIPKQHDLIAQKSTNVKDVSGQSSITNAQEAFQEICRDYDTYAKEFGFAGFWSRVYPAQARLVLAYVVEAFSSLGTKLASMSAGTKLPKIQTLPKHDLLVAQLYNILQDGELIQIRDDGKFRTSKPVDPTSSEALFNQILKDFPKHASEHKLLHITGSKLAQCLTGEEDALMLLFRPPANRKLLEDVYTNGPMYASVTKQLGTYFSRAMAAPARGEVFEILELGGGTGGTTKYLVEHLAKLKIPFHYTFTDISSALVGQMQRKMTGREYMSYAVVDIEKQPEQKHLGKYHAIVSTNCIHATSDLTVSGRNIRSMLRQDGFLALVEFTRNMFWFDLVFGLLDGWWFYKDGRDHVLADEFFWERSLRSAGYKHVTWTAGNTEESNTLRIITAFQQEARPGKTIEGPHVTEQTVLYKQVGQTSLFADLYYPPTVLSTEIKRPIALMIHGGGHIMLSRKDVRPKQTAELVRLGFLPISIDFRLCPEIDIQNGAMTDVRDAIQWARYQLPALSLGRPDIKVDSERLVVVGWSTGGTIAMTTAWTTVNAGLSPPNAIFAFYCPTDYEDECWVVPNYPNDSAKQAAVSYDLLEGVRDHPIASYNVPPTTAAAGGWMAPSDPRSRIVLHNNWRGQVLPTIINGLPTRTLASSNPAFSASPPILPQPPLEQIQQISPLAQIRKGIYKVPTFLLHTDADDLIPIDQARRTFNALQEKRVLDSRLVVVKGVPHLFDLYRKLMVGEAAGAVDEGYKWLAERVGL
ncbi:putative polyketide synthase [Xylogone sp. PMI_703]|nr:putative polyketide synthase [Xylogone sp. PMI_703]